MLILIAVLVVVNLILLLVLVCSPVLGPNPKAIAKAVDQAADAQQQCAVFEGQCSALYDMLKSLNRRVEALEQDREANA